MPCQILQLTHKIWTLCKLNMTFKTRISTLSLYKVTEIFPPVKGYSDSDGDFVDTQSVSHKLMLKHGIIQSQHLGMYTLLPLGMRSVEKLTRLLDLQMKSLRCQKLNLPTLTSASLWKQSGRIETHGAEVMSMCDRHHHKYFLSPTHEEAVTNLISKIKDLRISHLPIRLYQISSKFRDEKRLKHGLLREREFLMKDLYTFDSSILSAEETYEQVTKAYLKIFDILEIPVKQVDAPVGDIGGVKSHEFHVPCTIGEDSLFSCKNCDYVVNIELINDKYCPYCKNEMALLKAIEVGHTFLLGNKYSAPLSATFRNINGSMQELQMGCYGIGITRLLAAGIEVLSKNDSIIWPKSISPYKVCLIPPKRGSKEASSSYWCNYLGNIINSLPGFEDEVIVDDRVKLSIGQRLNYAKNFGFPIVVVIGKQALSSVPLFELHISSTCESFNLTQSELIEHLKNLS